MTAAILLAALAAPLAPLTPDEAIELQRAEVLGASESSPCRPGASPEEIVVCGRITGTVPLAPVTRYRPPQSFAAPERGPWFSRRIGPVTIACCAIEGRSGTGAGVSVTVGF